MKLGPGLEWLDGIHSSQSSVRRLTHCEWELVRWGSDNGDSRSPNVRLRWIATVMRPPREHGHGTERRADAAGEATTNAGARPAPRPPTPVQRSSHTAPHTARFHRARALGRCSTPRTPPTPPFWVHVSVGIEWGATFLHANAALVVRLWRSFAA